MRSGAVILSGDLCFQPICPVGIQQDGAAVEGAKFFQNIGPVSCFEIKTGTAVHQQPGMGIEGIHPEGVFDIDGRRYLSQWQFGGQ
ncbi:MAG: hypothetical protein Kow0027_06020 [Saprospiraceae bacterium]